MVRCLSQNVLAFSLLIFAVCGCGGPNEKLPDVVPFSGTVTLDGEPVEFAQLSFIPLNEEAGKSFNMNGLTNAEGEYEVSLLGFSSRVKGAVPGKYKVRISLLKQPDGTVADPASKPIVPGMEALPKIYSDTLETKLEATVPEEGGTQDFELKSN